MHWKDKVTVGTPGAPGPHLAAKTLELKTFRGEKSSWLLGPIFPPELTWPNSKALWHYLYPRPEGMEPLPPLEDAFPLREVSTSRNASHSSQLSPR